MNEASSEARGEKVCLVTGVGPGTGTALARRFAAGYRVAMIARSKERLSELEQELPGARGFPCDVADEDALRQTFERVAGELGPPAVVLHNAVGGAFGDFLETSAGVLRRNFEINTVALLTLAQLAAPAMIERRSGAIVCTGNTSAYRGKASFAGFAPTKAAQRILAEAMARRLGPEGVHVAYVAVDAVIDVPWTRRARPEKPDSWFCQPKDIALECWHVVHQPRSAWSFDVVIRPDAESW